MSVRFLAILGLVASATLTGGIAPRFVLPVQANSGSGVSQAGGTKIFAVDGIAINGTDPVAYFTQGRAVQGNQQYTYEWRGATWQFANAEHLAQFMKNPQAYVPQFGGFCAYGIAQGALVPTVPEAWSIVDGKLYLNYNATVQERWNQDIAGYIRQANVNWRRGLSQATR